MTSDTLPAGMVSAGPTVLRSLAVSAADPVSPLALLSWPALDAAGVDAAVTARSGGVSSGPYATLNLSLSVGDDPGCVLENRRRLAAGIGARPEDFVFARQVHGAGVRVVGEADRGSGAFCNDDAIADADALVTCSPGVVLAILTADCVPVVLHDPVAGVLACVHAGWRGTVARVPAAALAAMQALGSRPSDVIAGIGPAIALARYQVGPDVHQAVTQAFGPAASALIGSSTCGPPTATPSARPASPTPRSTPPPSPLVPSTPQPPQTPPPSPAPATSSVTAQPAPAAASPSSPASAPRAGTAWM